MGIIKDSGEILLLIYNDYVDNSNSITPRRLLEITGWDGDRIDRAIKHLRDIGAVEFIFTMGNIKGLQNFIIRGMLPEGIQIVENKEKFKHSFGFEVTIPFAKFSWKVSK